MKAPVRIAMWSGPRNLSTACMRSFSSRADCAVIDEPFYAAYLALTGLEHPMREDVLCGEQDANKVARDLIGPVPGGRSVYYQKHMVQHMVEGIPVGWMDQVTNVFLIRDPARVVASFKAKWDDAGADDFGFAAQGRMFARASDPIVVDAADIRADPAGILRKLCQAIGIGFDPAMLAWPSGPHEADGVWGAHWYNAIWQSTGFASAETSARPEVDWPEVMDPAMEIYEAMRAVRLH